MDSPRLAVSSRLKPVGQADPVVLDREPQPVALAGAADLDRPRRAPPTKACSTAFWISSVYTIASGVAASELIEPNEPVRRVRIGAPCEPTSVTSRVSRSVTSSKSTRLVEGLAERLVDDRDRPDPAYGLLERDPALGYADPAGLQPQQRRHRLQVVLHPVVDLADGRVLGDQLAVAAAQVGDVAQQDQPAGVLARRAAAGSSAGSAWPGRCRARCRAASGRRARH